MWAAMRAPQLLQARVHDKARVAPVGNALGERARQSHAFIERTQQQQPAVT